MDYPKLRYVDISPIQAEDRQFLFLSDPFHYTTEPVFVPLELFPVLRCLDGTHSVTDIQNKFRQQTSQDLPLEVIQEFVRELDSYFLLENETFYQHRQKVQDDFRALQIRPSSLAGTSYPEDASQLTEQLHGYFSGSGGPGKPNGSIPSDQKLIGAVIPHIDLRRGGSCFAYAYKEIVEKSDADLYVILGVKHAGFQGLFTTTEKDFETPLGETKTNREFLDLLQNDYAFNLLEDEFAHKNEHSIELQVVFMQAVFENNYEIVPIICGSFDQELIEGKNPDQLDEVQQFIGKLRSAIKKIDRKVCLIASVDGSHMGDRFGDSLPIDESLLKRIQYDDLELLRYIENLDVSRFLNRIQVTRNQNRVDGVCPIYVLLETLQPSSSKLLKYDQSVESEANSVVTFASMGFYA
ncbi:MAG: AmmeMemoRadiSam system protein B [Candidatus Poribacteria bacterium]|mgnify:FL=1